MISLPRPFIYRDRKDIDEFLDESQLWRDLYETFILVKDNCFQMDVSPLTMFNEVYYQCKRIVMDKHPEMDISGSYWNVVRDNYGSTYASELCFSMVYAVFMLQKSRPFNVDLFCKALRQNYFNEGDYFFYNFNHKVDSCIELWIVKYETDFTPSPYRSEDFDVKEWTTDALGNKVLKSRYDCYWWRDKTSDFDQDRIREIVNLWHTKEDRTGILKRIESAFDEYESLPF